MAVVPRVGAGTVSRSTARLALRDPLGDRLGAGWLFRTRGTRRPSRASSRQFVRRALPELIGQAERHLEGGGIPGDLRDQIAAALVNTEAEPWDRAVARLAREAVAGQRQPAVPLPPVLSAAAGAEGGHGTSEGET
jgi:hypothetical protein